MAYECVTATPISFFASNGHVSYACAIRSALRTSFLRDTKSAMQKGLHWLQNFLQTKMRNIWKKKKLAPEKIIWLLLIKYDKKTKYLIFLLSSVYLARDGVELEKVSLVFSLNDSIGGRVYSGFLAEKQSYASPWQGRTAYQHPASFPISNLSITISRILMCNRTCARSVPQQNVGKRIVRSELHFIRTDDFLTILLFHNCIANISWYGILDLYCNHKNAKSKPAHYQD